MIADAGGKLVIVGHSERRADHGETDALVRAKAEAGMAGRAVWSFCASAKPRPSGGAGETLAVSRRQLAGSVPDGATAAKLVVAYEPVWAIGTGLTPSNDDIQAAHAHIRAELVGRFGTGGGETSAFSTAARSSRATPAEILPLAGRRRRPGRWRQPQSRRFPGYRGGAPAKRRQPRLATAERDRVQGADFKDSLIQWKP